MPKSPGGSLKDLRNQHLKIEDIRDIVTSRVQSLVWDPDRESNSQWVFSSIETIENKNRLLDWLKSKNIDGFNQAIMVDPSWSVSKEVTFGEVVSKPERFFRAAPFQIIDLDLQWILEYNSQELIRFGRLC